MKYYKVSTNLNIKDIGVYPQSISSKMYWETINLLNLDGTIKKDFRLPNIILEPKAKHSTFIDSIVIPKNKFLTFKKYFVDFIKQFNIGEFKTWDLKVTHNKKIITDYCLFLLIDTSDAFVINYKESVFCIGKTHSKEDRKPVIINSSNEFNNISLVLIEEEKGKRILQEKILLDFSNVKQDLIRINSLHFDIGGYYVSERFKKAYEENRFTGIGFKEVEALDKVVEIKF